MNKQKLLMLLLSGVMLSSIGDVVGRDVTICREACTNPTPPLCEDGIRYFHCEGKEAEASQEKSTYFMWENDSDTAALEAKIDELLKDELGKEKKVNIVIADSGKHYVKHFPNTIFIAPDISTDSIAESIDKADPNSKFIFIKSGFEDFFKNFLRTDEGQIKTVKAKLKGRVNLIILDWVSDFQEEFGGPKNRESIILPNELIELIPLLSSEGRVLVPVNFFQKYFDKLKERFGITISQYDLRYETDQEKAIDNTSSGETKLKADAFTPPDNSQQLNLNYEDLFGNIKANPKASQKLNQLSDMLEFLSTDKQRITYFYETIIKNEDLRKLIRSEWQTFLKEKNMEIANIPSDPIELATIIEELITKIRAETTISDKIKPIQKKLSEEYGINLKEVPIPLVGEIVLTCLYDVSVYFFQNPVLRLNSIELTILFILKLFGISEENFCKYVSIYNTGERVNSIKSIRITQTGDRLNIILTPQKASPQVSTETEGSKVASGNTNLSE